VSPIVDLSPPVPHGFKGPPSTDLGVQLDVRTRPGYWQSAQLAMSCHTGTHVESALHVLEDGEPIDAVALDRVIGPAVLLDLTPVAERALVDVPALERAVARLADAGEAVRPGDIVLLRTDWAQRAIGTPQYFRRSPALTADAAAWLVALEPRCVGCDFFEEPAARDPGWKADEFVVHRAILSAGIPLVEGLVNLDALPPRCEFFAPFYRLAGVEAAPARAFARTGGAAG
jgi:kynurenine formamidase